MKVTLLFFEGCPNWQATNAHLESMAVEFDFDRGHGVRGEDALNG